jgi:hypothetical protein
MCVTARPAIITGSTVVVKAISNTRHAVFYQNNLRTPGPNCMFLDIDGYGLELLPALTKTHSFMRDVTRDLDEIVPVPRMRGGSLSMGDSKGVVMEAYGDGVTLRSPRPEAILDALSDLPPEYAHLRLPAHLLAPRADFYTRKRPGRCFVLYLFDGSVKMEYPLAFQHTPHNPEVLTAPGLDGHDGSDPVIGAPVDTGFTVAFAINGQELEHPVRYSDYGVEGEDWAPESVAGFIDNRVARPNDDYVASVKDLKAGLNGPQLLEAMAC